MAKKEIAGVPVQEMLDDDEFIAVAGFLAELDKNGHEMLNPKPMYPTVGFQNPPTLEQQIRALLQEARVREAIEAEGFETPEEADDFDVGDDFEPFSFHEFSEEEEEIARAYIQARREEEARRATPATPAPVPSTTDAPSASEANSGEVAS